MSDYRRIWSPGDTCFFTVNLLQCHGNDLLVRYIEARRNALRSLRPTWTYMGCFTANHQRLSAPPPKGIRANERPSIFCSRFVISKLKYLI